MVTVFLQTHSVETPYGSVTFTVYGTPKPKRPAILTYHDVGLNCKDLSFPTAPFWEEAGGKGKTPGEGERSARAGREPCGISRGSSVLV